MTTPPDPAAYKLTEDQIKERFELKVRPALEGPPSEQPTWVLIMGQMAAGKSTAMTVAPQLFGLSGQALRDADEDVYIHPDYRRLRDSYDARIARQMTQHVSGPISKMSYAFLLEHRRDLVVSGPMANPEWIARTFRPAVEAGFRIEMVCMATNEAWSRLGTVDRFQKAEDAHPGHGEWLPPFWHDAHLAGIPQTLTAVEQRGLADGLHIMRRGGQLIYSNQLVSREQVQWQHPPRAVQALKEEYARPWTDQEHRDFRDRAISLLGRQADPEKRVIVVDSVNRSHAPNERAITEMAVQARAMDPLDRAGLTQIQERIRTRAGYSSELRAAEREWALNAAPWRDRPHGAETTETLASTVAQSPERAPAMLSSAAKIREQAVARLTAAKEGNGQQMTALRQQRADLQAPAQGTSEGSAGARLEQLTGDWDRLAGQAMQSDVQAAEAELTSANRRADAITADAQSLIDNNTAQRGELLIRQNLSPERASAEEAERKQQAERTSSHQTAAKTASLGFPVPPVTNIRQKPTPGPGSSPPAAPGSRQSPDTSLGR